MKKINHPKWYESIKSTREDLKKVTSKFKDFEDAWENGNDYEINCFLSLEVLYEYEQCHNLNPNIYERKSSNIKNLW